MPQNNRPLTYDENKAAEAAFKGLPFDPKWSNAAYKVYEGLSLAMAHTSSETFQDPLPSEAIPFEMEVVSGTQQRSQSLC